MKTSKANLVDDILVNDLYMPDSGVYKEAEKALFNLSRNQLECISLIIHNKNLNEHYSYSPVDNPPDRHLRGLP